MMMNNLYGSSNLTIEDAKSFLERKLNIKFLPKDSLYQGEYYRYGEDGSENFLLKKNIDPLDGEPAELNFSNCSILLYVNHTERTTELNNLLNKDSLNIFLLRQINS